MVLDWLFIDCFCSLLVFLRIIEYDMLVKIKQGVIVGLKIENENC